MSKNKNTPPVELPDIDGVIVLQQTDELFIARFIPPIPAGIKARKKHDGHPPNSPIARDEHGGITHLTYDRDTFGWNKNDREKDFIKYNKHVQAKRLGYTVTSKSVEKVTLPKPSKIISSVARRGKKK